MNLFNKKKKLAAELERQQEEQRRRWVEIQLQEQIRKQQEDYERREQQLEIQRQQQLKAQQEEHQRREYLWELERKDRQQKELKEAEAKRQARLAVEKEQREKEERLARQRERLGQTTPEALRGLRNLIRTRYQLDMEIWSLKGARGPDRPLVVEKMNKADAVLEQIMGMVETWTATDYADEKIWTPEEWVLAQRIKEQVFEKGKRIWKDNPPWNEAQVF